MMTTANGGGFESVYAEIIRDIRHQEQEKWRTILKTIGILVAAVASRAIDAENAIDKIDEVLTIAGVDF